MQPIFLVAVPRSGSTMLRLILNAHPAIYSGEEMPWLGGNYRVKPFDPEVSVRCLHQRLLSVAHQNQNGLEREQITKVVGDFVKNIIELRLKAGGKHIWVEKTPDNIIQVRFLKQLFPQAKFLRVVRDGRDVALSTIKSKGWAQINYFIDGNAANHKLINIRKSLNRRLLFKLPRGLQEIVARSSLEPAQNEQEPNIFYPIANTYFNALHRWNKWNEFYDANARDLGLNELTVKYEDMLVQPHETLARIFSFLGTELDERVLDYRKYQDRLDPGDLGVSSALKFSSVEPQNAYKWKKALTKEQRRITRRYFDPSLVSRGYESTV